MLQPHAAPILPAIFLCLSLFWWAGSALVRQQLAAWITPLVVFLALLATYLQLDVHASVARYWFADTLRAPVPLARDRLYLSLYPAPQAWYQAGTTGMPFGSVVRPGSTALFAGVHLINGYSPVGPAGIARLLDFGTHGQINPARVREVVFEEGGPEGLLAEIGIDGVIAGRGFAIPIGPSEEWERVFASDEGEVFHRRRALAPVRALPGQSFANAEIRLLENSRQHVVAEIIAAEPGKQVRVIFSRPYFPGYRATFDGVPLAVNAWHGLAPVVELPANSRGRLELTYRPRAVTLGGAIAGLTLLLGLASLAISRRRACSVSLS